MDLRDLSTRDQGPVNQGPGTRDLWTRDQEPVNQGLGICGPGTRNLWTMLNKFRSFIKDLTICCIDPVTSIKYVYGAEIYICNFSSSLRKY